MKLYRVLVDEEKCVECRFCQQVNICYSKEKCVGCLSCYWACPYSAKFMEEVDCSSSVEIEVDGSKFRVPENLTVARALEHLGYRVDRPCGTGGCWSCAMLINGSVERACITPVKDKMVINIRGTFEPLRIVHGPEPHLVGGKATPWLEVDYFHYVEAAIWLAGCNLRCPQCQNFGVTYDNSSLPLTPKEAAKLIFECQKTYSTRGIAVSGGEPTINRRWLVKFFKEVSKLVKPKVRKHLDSNGTMLTPDYIDELVEAGCNNIGVEPKCSRVETYMKITGVERGLAEKYLKTSWEAIEYIWEKYRDRVYLGVGLVYNSELVTLDEIAEAGEKIYSIDKRIQVTVLDYFPTFRRRNLKRPEVEEMLEVKKVLEDVGLETVIVQTSHGHVGPKDRRPVRF